MLAYAVELTPDDNQTMLATVPAFPEITTFLEKAEDLLPVVSGAIEEAIAARMSIGADIPASDVRPAPSSDASWLQLSSLVSIKAALYQLMRVKGVTRADLQRRLGWHREQVDRLFRLDHASRMDQLEAAAHELGFEVHVEIREAA